MFRTVPSSLMILNYILYTVPYHFASQVKKIEFRPAMLRLFKWDRVTLLITSPLSLKISGSLFADAQNCAKNSATLNSNNQIGWYRTIHVLYAVYIVPSYTWEYLRMLLMMWNKTTYFNESKKICEKSNFLKIRCII